MRPPSARFLVLVGAMLLGVAVATLIWPLHGTGVAGTALSPRYPDHGWTFIPPDPTRPRATVASLRWTAAGEAALGAGLLAVAATVRRRSRGGEARP